MNKKTYIKYDQKFYKMIKAVMVISFVLTVIFVASFLLGANVKAKEINDILAVILVLTVLAGNIGIPVFILSLVLYLDASVYLKRLKKNGFEVPLSKKDYRDDLANVSRSVVTENNYAGDSKHLFVIFLASYFICLAFDIAYLLKWYRLNTDSVVLFVFLILFHLLFLVAAFAFLQQRDTGKYIDTVDIKDARKVRMSITGGVALLVIMGLIAAFSIMTANSMTDYIYKSRNRRYDKTIDDFKMKATMSVSSESLHEGVWDAQITNTEEGSNLSPQLSFDAVDGADHYFIYMVDESANYWVHWLVTDVTDTELEEGVNISDYSGDGSFKYTGPYPPKGSGEHIYTIVVFAMKGDPDSDMEMEFDKSFFSPDILYYDVLNISEKGDPDIYGNVLAYGYISGVYER